MKTITHQAHRRKSKSGFTLIELMVASLAGLIAVATVYTLSSGATRHFHEQQRVSQTQTSLRLAMEQIRADIERAGFGSTPNSRVDSTCITPQLQIQAIEFLNDLDNALLPNSAVNVVEADVLRLVGNYSTSGSYLATGTDGAGENIQLQSAWQAFRRDFGVPGVSFDSDGYEDVFKANQLVHIESLEGYHFFPQIQTPDPTNFTVGLTPPLPVGTACLPGLADGAMVTPLRRIEYRVVNPAGDGLTELVSNNPQAPNLGINSAVLVRREVDFTALANPDLGTDRIVLEYVADFHLEFILDMAADEISPANLQQLEGANAANLLGTGLAAEPERVRSVIISVSARTPGVDPRFPFIAGRGVRTNPLLRYAVVGVAPNSPAARVRTITSEIFLPNVAARNLR